MSWYRLSDAVILRDERHSGSGEVSLIWRKDQRYSLNVIDSLTCEVLLRLVNPLSTQQIGEIVLEFFRQRGKVYSAERAYGAAQLLLDKLIERKWVEVVENPAPSKARLFPSIATDGFQPNWAPLRSPMDVTLSVTMKCNLRCKHCGLSCSPTSEYPQELNTAEMIDLLKQMEDVGVVSLSLSGGEIFIRPDWRELVEATLAASYELTIATNGVALSPEDIEYLIDCNRRRQQCFTLAVSLDGATAKNHGWMRGGEVLFHKTVANISALAQGNVPIIIGMSLNQKNAHEIKDMLHLAHRLGVGSIEYHPIEIYGRAKQHILDMALSLDQVKEQVLEVDELRHQAKSLGISIDYEAKRVPMESAFLEQHGVAADSMIFKQFAYPPGAHDAGLLKCCISADGMMYPSDKAQGFQPLAISSVRGQNLEQAWLSENWAFFRGGWSLDQLYQCRDCSLFATCSTRHNRIIPYVSLGDPFAAMPECQTTYAKQPLHA